MISPKRPETNPVRGKRPCRGRSVAARVGWAAGRPSWGRRQVADSDQVVHGGREGEHPADPPHPAMPRLPKQGYRLEPAEDLFAPFAALLAGEVPREPGRPIVDRAGPVGGVF